MVTKVPFASSLSPSLTHVTFVGGDPDDEQFRVKAAAGLTCSDVILTGAMRRDMKMSTLNFLHSLQWH